MVDIILSQEEVLDVVLEHIHDKYGISFDFQNWTNHLGDGITFSSGGKK